VRMKLFCTILSLPFPIRYLALVKLEMDKHIEYISLKCLQQFPPNGHSVLT
jgi:hypothetical protein